jgi:hypothetical protein
LATSIWYLATASSNVVALAGSVAVNVQKQDADAKISLEIFMPVLPYLLFDLRSSGRHSKKKAAFTDAASGPCLTIDHLPVEAMPSAERDYF